MRMQIKKPLGAIRAVFCLRVNPQTGLTDKTIFLLGEILPNCCAILSTEGLLMFSKTQASTAKPRKPIFDTFRTILKRGFRQSEVDALDRAFDCALGDQSACGASGKFTAGPEAVAIIKRFEGCARLRTDGLIEAYPDPATGDEPWTVGWGATGYDLDGLTPIGPGTVWTQQQADDRLARDLAKYAAEVADAIGQTATTQSQFDAMLSFHYNTGAIHRATLTKKHLAGDFGGAAGEFQRWNKAAGRVLKGLTRRRLAEAKLYAMA
jgi:GH24 family phage-related lysozyme (muramidase)